MGYLSYMETLPLPYHSKAEVEHSVNFFHNHLDLAEY